MIGGVLFLVGFVGLILVSIFFAWEFKTQTRVFGNVRTKCDRVVGMTYRTLVFGEIPHVYRTSFIAKARGAIHQIVHSLILLLRAIERPLARFSRRMTYTQGGSSSNGERTPSPFLTDITPKGRDGKKPDNPV